MSSPKWSGKSKRFNPNRNFVMSDSNQTRKFNPKSTFSPSFSPTPASAPPTAPASLSGGIQRPATTPNMLSGVASFPDVEGLIPGMGSPLAGRMSPSSIAGISPDLGSAIPTAMPSSDALEYAALYHPPLHPLQYNMYAPTPYRHHMDTLEPHERRAVDLTLPQDLRKELHDRNEATLQVLPASALPEFVHVYHSLVPLDLGTGVKEMELWNHSTRRYKAISHTDGRTYCLLVIGNFEIGSENEHALQVINKWKRVQSSAAVGVIEAFTTFAFTNPQAHSEGPSAIAKSWDGSTAASMSPASNGGAPANSSLNSPDADMTADTSSTSISSGKSKSPSTDLWQSLVVVCEWHPLSKPLATLPDPSEQVLWTIAVQLFSGLQTIHRRGLACRGVMNEHFILLQSKNRVRIGSLGVRDILQPDFSDVQANDYRDLGAMLQRLSGSAPASAPFNEFTKALEEGNVERASQLLTPHLYRAIDVSYQSTDILEEQLALELENARLVRLLAKLEFVLNTPDAFDPRNPNYLLVLFKQYVFRQRTEEGKPSLNLAHAIAALNKLDAGIDENVLLTDSKTRVVISYKELKQMFSSAFEKMAKA